MLIVENLWKVFNKNTPNETVLFDGLSLTVNAGEYISIIGSNGAGKSTLLNIIAGSIKSDEGSIFLEDDEISRKAEYKCAQNIGRVFQNPTLGVVPTMTILENMAMADNKGKKFGFKRGINKNRINDYIDMLKGLNLGLEDKLNVTVGMLSGGQRQALSLIMSIMKKPKLLLLDEHTAALDPKTSERIIEITDKMVEANNITTLMVTHNLNHAISTGNRLIMMHRGNIVIDIKGEEKENLTVEKLLKYFENLKINDELSDRVIFS